MNVRSQQKRPIWTPMASLFGRTHFKLKHTVPTIPGALVDREQEQTGFNADRRLQLKLRGQTWQRNAICIVQRGHAEVKVGLVLTLSPHHRRAGVKRASIVDDCLSLG